MKKILILLMSLGLVLAVVIGCSDDDDSPTDENLALDADLSMGTGLDEGEMAVAHDFGKCPQAESPALPQQDIVRQKKYRCYQQADVKDEHQDGEPGVKTPATGAEGHQPEEDGT